MNAAALWLLVAAANAAPLAGAGLDRWLGHPAPLDLGLRLPDGRPLFGTHKHWRGLALSLIATAAAAWLLHLPVTVGLRVAAWAMTGDLLASLIKRRLAIAPGGSVMGLDQLPESLLPLAMVGRPGLSWTLIALLAVAFMAFDIALRQLHSRLRRER